MFSSRLDKFIKYPLWSAASLVERLRRKIGRTETFQSFRRYFHIRPAPVIRPIFIIGTVRSGKTTLARHLSYHPRIIYLGHELTTEWCDLAGIEIARTNNNKAHCPPYSESDATESRRNRVRSGFSELLTIKGGNSKSRFLDDNPHLWNKLAFVRRIFPDAQLIIMSQDIRSTVASTKLLWERVHADSGKKYYFPPDETHCWSVIPPASEDGKDERRIFPGGDVTALAEYWIHTYSMIQQEMDAFENAVVVKHKTLATDINKTLTRVCSAIGISPLRLRLSELDHKKSEIWQDILTAEEQRTLNAYVEKNRRRIEKLTCAESTV